MAYREKTGENAFSQYPLSKSISDPRTTGERTEKTAPLDTEKPIREDGKEERRGEEDTRTPEACKE